MTKEEAARLYTLSKSDASWLSGAVLMPPDTRQKVFERYAEEKGQAALVNLFTQFVGLANAVVESGLVFTSRRSALHVSRGSGRRRESNKGLRGVRPAARREEAGGAHDHHRHPRADETAQARRRDQGHPSQGGSGD